MIWLTSDNHFSHGRIIEYCNRPFKSMHEMDAEMINRWNSKVKTTDVVYHLGDIALVNKAGIIKLKSHLNGTIKIVKGNHDRTVTSLIKCGFIVIHEGYHRIEGIKFRLSHPPRGRRPPKRIWNIHGHVHCSLPIEEDEHLNLKYKRINVGVDYWDYYPVSFEKIKEIINAN